MTCTISFPIETKLKCSLSDKEIQNSMNFKWPSSDSYDVPDKISTQLVKVLRNHNQTGRHQSASINDNLVNATSPKSLR